MQQQQQQQQQEEAHSWCIIYVQHFCCELCC
jgi:hypothetical protein